MTEQEKALAYDRAIERAKKLKEDPKSVFYEYSPKEGDTICDYIFPELKESEENIKDSLMQYLWDLWHKDSITPRPDITTCDKWIAWLEKQNPQKLDNVVKPIFNVGDTVRHKTIEGFECTIESIDDLTYYGDTTNFDIKDQNKWKLIEPIDSIAYSKDTVWNESDRLHLGSILSILKAERNNAEVEQYRDSVNSDIDWLKSLKNCVSSSQLNTEDFERINRISDFIWKNRKGDTDEIYQQEQDVKWLKSLKDCIQLHPKQGWGDDDEKMVNDIIAAIDTLYYHGMVNWLKSLKNRCTWKPNENQLHAFEQVYDWYNNNFAPSETLTSLYNDLKKLYEK